MRNEVMDYRRARLSALLDHRDFGGNKAELGRALGYKDGAYVRQMLADERPITEKLVEKIEAMRGGRYAGWFAAEPGTPREAFAALEDDGPEDDTNSVERDVWQAAMQAGIPPTREVIDGVRVQAVKRRRTMTPAAFEKLMESLDRAEAALHKGQ